MSQPLTQARIQAARQRGPASRGTPGQGQHPPQPEATSQPPGRPACRPRRASPSGRSTSCQRPSGPPRGSTHRPVVSPDAATALHMQRPCCVVRLLVVPLHHLHHRWWGCAGHCRGQAALLEEGGWLPLPDWEWQGKSQQLACKRRCCVPLHGHPSRLHQAHQGCCHPQLQSTELPPLQQLPAAQLNASPPCRMPHPPRSYPPTAPPLLTPHPATRRLRTSCMLLSVEAASRATCTASSLAGSPARTASASEVAESFLRSASYWAAGGAVQAWPACRGRGKGQDECRWGAAAGAATAGAGVARAQVGC